MSRVRVAVTGAAARAAGALLVHGGLAVGALQRVAPGTSRTRPLSADEVRTLREVFDDAVPLDDVRVVPERGGTGVFGASDRPFTLGTTIYLKGDRRASLLVHEVVHVWQYRRSGVRYAADAVVAQLWGHAYDWRAAVVAGASRWTDLDVEGQAQFLQDLYDGGSGVEHGRTVVGGGAYVRAHDAGAERDFPGHRALAEDALATLRGR